MAETLPAIPIAFSPVLSEEPRVRRVKFGDGYEARLTDGLNPIGVKTTIPWTNRSQDARNVLVDFFRRHQGRTWFWWTCPGDNIRRKWVCSRWTSTRSDNSPAHSPRYDVSAEVYEIFDLGT